MIIKKGDTVKMLAGKDRGKTGKVIRIFQATGKIVVEGLNLIKKNKRPKKQGEKGEIVSLPRAIDSSNASLICSNCKKTVRVGFKKEGNKKVRFCRKCNSQI